MNTTGSTATGVDTEVGRPCVEVDRLVVDRGRRRALDHLSITIPAGAVTGVLGPSGSGKTTLMRAIVGTQQIRAGTVTVLGQPAGTPDLRRRVGYTTQAPSVYDDLTVTANTGYFAALHGVPDRAAADALADVGLTEHADQLAGTLSGGERSRLSLACALVAAPELLVLDEPTVGLDPVLRDGLWARFRDLASRGASLVVTSHVMDEAARCDRLALLREGRLVADTTPDDLRATAGTADLDEAFLRLIVDGTEPRDDT